MAFLHGHAAALLLISAVLAAATTPTNAIAESGTVMLLPRKGARQILGLPDDQAEKTVVASLEEEDGDAAAELFMPRILFGKDPAYGGDGGVAFDDGEHDRITSLTLRCGSVVDGIETTYADTGARKYTHGSTTGGTAKKVNFNFRDQMNIEIGSRVRNGRRVVGYLKFTQGLGVVTCGSSTTALDITYTRYRVTGFHGRSGSLIDKIGLYIRF